MSIRLIISRENSYMPTAGVIAFGPPRYLLGSVVDYVTTHSSDLDQIKSDASVSPFTVRHRGRSMTSACLDGSAVHIVLLTDLRAGLRP